MLFSLINAEKRIGMNKKILIVDDSALMRRVMSDIIASDKRFIIADVAMNGLEAFDMVTLNPRKYDAILLDINMPKMNGIQFLEKISKLGLRLKVIIVSTIVKEGASETVRCLELGAFDFITKPDSLSESKGPDFKNKVLSVLSLAAGLTRGTDSLREFTTPSRELVKSAISFGNSKTMEGTARKQHQKVISSAKKLVALTCSTGGPKALQRVIPKLPANLDAPVVMVQHMPEGFTATFAQHLDETSMLKVKEAEHGDIVQKGTVYLAKGGSQMRLVKKGSNYMLSVTVEPARGGLRPCADIMYESLVNSDFDDITCVVLTGMGGDGTLGIKQLNERNNIYVIAQDEASSTVYGMPKVVREAGLTDEVVTLESVADAIIKNVGVR